MEHMQLKKFGEDTEATALLPQLDIRILSTALERVERSDASAEQPAPNVTPEWKLTDRLAELQDQVASLHAALRESENRHSRLTARHATLLHKFEERETCLADKQHELSQAQDRLITLEQQLQQMSSAASNLNQLMADSTQQRKQHEQFILKQAREIKRLRKLLS
jgi:chromosome segregation ATPase